MDHARKLEPWLTGDYHAGRALYYPGGSGICSLPEHPKAPRIALPPHLYAAGAGCGLCLEIVGPKATLTVQGGDLCIGCAEATLDLSPAVYARAIGFAAGASTGIRWRAVPCPTEGRRRYHFKPGTTDRWAPVQVRNTPWPVFQIELSSDGRALPRTRDGYFLLQPTVDEPTVRVRLRTVRGETIEDVLTRQPPR